MQPQSPAADVLLALGKFNENRQLLIASAARPYARFWANYDDGPGTLLPHLARVKGCAQYLSLHADAALKAGDRETAIEDVKAAFRLIESIRREPTLIAQLVRIAALQIALQPVWEGLADRQWTEAELSVIEGELGKLDFLADYEFAMRGERDGCELWVVDYIRKAGITGLDEMVSPSQEFERVRIGQVSGHGTVPAGPGGLVRPEQTIPLPAARELPAAGRGFAAARRLARHSPHGRRLLSISCADGPMTSSRRCCCRPWPGQQRGSLTAKPRRTWPASPARWSATGWRTASSPRRSKRWRRSSSRSCRTTSSMASRSNTAAPMTASSSSTRSGGTKRMTAAKSN